MPDSAPHPLSRFSSIDELMALPYFELLACITDQSLHPGGGVATQLLLDECRLERPDRVLEIGCGPGWTSRALKRAGIAVSVVDKSPLMIEAMLHHFQSVGISPPPFRNSAIEELADSQPFGHRFEVVLLECVVGFIGSKHALARAINRNISRPGRVGVVDLHYTQAPSHALQDQLEAVTGHRIDPMMRDDWLNLFPELRLRNFKAFDLPERPGETAASLVEKSEVARWLPDIGQADLDRLIERIEIAGDVFTANKKLMAGHIAVYDATYSLGG